MLSDERYNEIYDYVMSGKEDMNFILGLSLDEWKVYDYMRFMQE